MIITGLSTPHAPHFLFSLLRSNHMRCTSGPPHLEGGGGGGGGGGGSGRVLSLSSQSSILSFLFSLVRDAHHPSSLSFLFSQSSILNPQFSGFLNSSNPFCTTLA